MPTIINLLLNIKRCEQIRIKYRIMDYQIDFINIFILLSGAALLHPPVGIIGVLCTIELGTPPFSTVSNSQGNK